MKDDQRKILTEYLGECWKVRKIDSMVGKPYKCDECSKCFRDKPRRRTFTTPDDFFDLKNKLVKKGDWEEFISYYEKSLVYFKNSKFNLAVFSYWLINAPRFCDLVGEFLEKGGEGMNLTFIGGTHFCVTCHNLVTVKLVAPNQWVCMKCGGADIKRVKEAQNGKD